MTMRAEEVSRCQKYVQWEKNSKPVNHDTFTNSHKFKETNHQPSFTWAYIHISKIHDAFFMMIQSDCMQEIRYIRMLFISAIAIFKMKYWNLGSNWKHIHSFIHLAIRSHPKHTWGEVSKWVYHDMMSSLVSQKT